jgi:hypothetical protein
VRKIRLVDILVCLSLALTFPLVASAQKSKSESHVGFGVKISSLGVGVEAAVPVLRKVNIRAGGNFISYSHTLNQDGVTYKGSLNWRSGEASLDWFPFWGFHVSPGVLFYNGNKITATASVPGGQTFTLNGTSYTSDPTKPITGIGSVGFTKFDPKLTFGFGNLIPRSGRHWSILGEFGVAYQGSPKAALAFQGNACNGGTCMDAASNPAVVANVAAEQTKLNNDLSFFKFYPIVSIGFGFNF